MPGPTAGRGGAPSLPAPQTLEGWAAAAKALGDPTRLALAIALAESGSACVCDLAWIVARDEKLVSHHVRALRAAGLAVSSRKARWRIYKLTDREQLLCWPPSPPRRR